MEEKKYVVGLLSPYLSIVGQNPFLYITTMPELDEFTSKLIKLEERDTAYIRYVRGWEEVEVIKVEKIETRSKAGIEKVVNTRNQGNVKLIFTYLKGKLIYARSKEVEKRRYYRGYYIEEVENFGLVIKDGYIPLDKDIGVGNLKILQHNKRKLIKKGVNYIHNHLESIMGLIDTVYHTENEMIVDNNEINLGYFIDNILYNSKGKYL